MCIRDRDIGAEPQHKLDFKVASIPGVSQPHLARTLARTNSCCCVIKKTTTQDGIHTTADIIQTPTRTPFVETITYRPPPSSQNWWRHEKLANSNSFCLLPTVDGKQGQTVLLQDRIFKTLCEQDFILSIATKKYKPYTHKSGLIKHR